MKCKLCEREADLDLCGYHAEAKKRLESSYQVWREAYGFIGWTDYLNEILRNPDTGRWVVEVARFVLTPSLDGDSG
jgi:hypothetical protein